MTNDINPEQIKNVLAGISIPPQPQILVDLQMEQAMPNPDLGEVASLIAQDVGLSGSILKIVNSKFYDLSNQISSVKQAVEILGLECIVNIVNGIAIKGELSDKTIVSMSGFWDSAMDVAMVSATIAKKIGFQSPDIAHTLGLFHNAGIPLLMKTNPQYLDIIEQAYEGNEERVIDLENARLNTNHAVVGYYVAKSWKLPKDLCEVIAEHHNAEKIFNSPHFSNYDSYKKTLLSILKISEHLCKTFHTIGKQSTDCEWDKFEPALLEYVGLSTDDFEGLADAITELGIGGGEYFSDQPTP
ncbi:MAG: HDOD domain-containing protein [Pseudomonadales bacterium]|nr:HDOD domain-containing protein [Pseudomonadales bacterium]